MRVLLDANVLYPTVMREVLLGCARAGLFEPLWSARILEEWARAAARLGPEGEAVARAEVAAAGLAISRAHLSLEEGAVLVLVYTAVATCTVVVPIVLTILLPHMMEPRLLAAKEWIAAHSTGVSATLMILIGAFVIYLGISG